MKKNDVTMVKGNGRNELTETEVKVVVKVSLAI